MSAPTFSDLQPRLLLEKVPLNSNWSFPEMTLGRKDKLQVLLSEVNQERLLESWFNLYKPLVYQNNRTVLTVGNALGMVLNRKGLLANLSIKENIMLPFLYASNAEDIEQAHVQLERVADTLGLIGKLDEQAGLRSPLTHGLVSLCRCVLQQASFVVMQQPCASMSLTEVEQFRPIAARVIESLGAGLIYLTTSEDDHGGFTFSSYLTLLEQEVDT